MFDLRFEPPGESRQFKLLMDYSPLIDYIARYGAAHGGERGQPLSVIIDEVTALFAESGASSRLLVADLDGLINRLSRNYNIQITASYQELFQLPERPSPNAALARQPVLRPDDRLGDDRVRRQALHRLRP